MDELGRLVEVLESGALTTVQDLGRPGHAHLGVPRSGALDQPALGLANRLVGNDEDAACLETTLTGLTLRLPTAAVVAVTGALCAVYVDGRAAPWGSAFRVPDGATLRVGRADAGVRSVVAFSGGIAVPPVLGSRSTDLLSGLGPAPLREGDVLPLGTPQRPPAPLDTPVMFRAAEVLRVLPGPRDDWFTPASVAALDGASCTVSPASNRIGLRLQGPALVRSRPDELLSEPMLLGAVQVPPDGQPVILLNDHATTGGYPVVGVVRRADLAACAQLRPGDPITLRFSPRGR